MRIGPYLAPGEICAARESFISGGDVVSYRGGGVHGGCGDVKESTFRGGCPVGWRSRRWTRVRARKSFGLFVGDSAIAVNQERARSSRGQGKGYSSSRNIARRRRTTDEIGENCFGCSRQYGSAVPEESGNTSAWSGDHMGITRHRAITALCRARGESRGGGSRSSRN